MHYSTVKTTLLKFQDTTIISGVFVSMIFMVLRFYDFLEYFFPDVPDWTGYIYLKRHSGVYRYEVKIGFIVSRHL